MTKEERQVWYKLLKRLPVTVRRQKVISHYIVDFYCASAKTVIEIDGGQHYKEAGKAKDEERDAYLNSLGLKVLRYSNYDVDHYFEGVCIDILNHLGFTWDDLKQDTSSVGSPKLAATFPSEGKVSGRSAGPDPEKR